MKNCKTASRYTVATCAVCPKRADCETFAARPRDNVLQDKLTILSDAGQGDSDFAQALRTMRR